MNPAELAALHARCLTVPRPYTEAELSAFLNDPLVFLATAPSGFALGRTVAEEAELLTLVVAPEARRKGTGRHLLAAFESVAYARGAQQAHLEVSARNAGALALYQSAGYAETGLRRRYYSDGTDALTMAK